MPLRAVLFFLAAVFLRPVLLRAVVFFLAVVFLRAVLFRPALGFAAPPIEPPPPIDPPVPIEEPPLLPPPIDDGGVGGVPDGCGGGQMDPGCFFAGPSFPVFPSSLRPPP